MTAWGDPEQTDPLFERLLFTDTHLANTLSFAALREVYLLQAIHDAVYGYSALRLQRQPERFSMSD